ncbi:MAG TPA: cbb3-type cytochrome c oxidase subunit I, partial [Blastocatellia bacterium]|nr:cbb3-type cytochrome c oxidase subunit I [Blastocatellia bacterium]
AASTIIALPSGVQIFCWLATLWAGKLHIKTPLLFILGFFFIFVMGGLTGVMLASVSFDLQAHDTYFVVAHFHYVLIGGAVFPLFGAFYYWFPKFTGRLMSETLGRWNFWLFAIGFNITFFPMHWLGLQGMTRRIYTYKAEMGWGGVNLVASLGAALIAISVVIFLVNVWKSLRAGELAGANPWQAGTLEWATASPPPSYNFLRIPTVTGREALWEQIKNQPVVTGLSVDRRETLVTYALSAEPDHRFVMPDPTIWPFLTAIATAALFIGTIFTPWALPIGAIPVTITLIGWFWPNRQEHEEEVAAELQGIKPQEQEAH